MGSFSKEALFLNEFSGTLNFSYADFREGAQFNQAKFGGDVLFYYANLKGYFHFSHISLEDDCSINLGPVGVKKPDNNLEVIFRQLAENSENKTQKRPKRRVTAHSLTQAPPDEPPRQRGAASPPGQEGS